MSMHNLNGNGVQPPANSNLTASGRLNDFLASADKETPSHLAEAFGWEWMTPTAEDQRAMVSAISLCISISYWGRQNLSNYTRGDKVILVIPKHGPLHEAGIEAAREARKTAKRTVIWELDFGHQECPDLAAYAESFSLDEEIEWWQPWNWTDDPRASEPDESQAASAGEPVEWGQPGSLATQLLPVPTLEPEMIPEPFRLWLIDIAERGCFPIEYGAACAIVMLSGVVGRRLGIRPKREDDWLAVPNLWGAIVGHSGVQKSPPVREAMWPVRKIKAMIQKDHEQAMADFEAARIVAQVEQAVAKVRIRKSAEKGWTRKEELKKMAAAANKENALPVPIERRILVNDVTVAKLGEILADNPDGVIIFRDELMGFLKSMEMQGHESDRGFHLEAWNGNGSYTFDRIGRGQTNIPYCCESIFGTIQPGPLAKYLRGSFRGEDADGFLPRFQILLYPDPPKSFVNKDRRPDQESRDAAFKIFNAIWKLDPSKRGCVTDEREGISYLHFSHDAQCYFDKWREVLENRLRNGSTSHLFLSHLAKYRSLFPSLALLFHLIECAGARGKIGPVSLEAAELAGSWCAFLESHARRVYVSAQDGDPEGPTNLGDRIIGALPNPFTIRDIQRKGWSGLTSQEEIRRAVGILEDRQWVQPALTAANAQGGRPTEVFWINPALSVQAQAKT
jgi:hypothetical protein